jgi:hypothetical protein
MEHTFSSKQIVSKVTRKYESLLDLAFLKVYPAKFYQVSDYRLSRASRFAVRSSMEQIKSTGLVLSEKNNLVQIPIGFHMPLC